MKRYNSFEELERLGYENGTPEFIAMLTYFDRLKNEEQKQKEEQKKKKEKEDENRERISR